MGAILFIEDDDKIEGLIKMILPEGDFKVFRSSFPKKDVFQEKQKLPAGPCVPMEEAMRVFLREEINSERQGNIHEAIINKVEKVLIGTVLEEEKGNQVRAAKRLGINRNTLRKKIKEFHIVTRVIAS